MRSVRMQLLIIQAAAYLLQLLLYQYRIWHCLITAFVVRKIGASIPFRGLGTLFIAVELCL